MNSHLVSSHRSKLGRYVAPKGALIAGAVTRREWLNFLRKVEIGDVCCCGAGVPHRHLLWRGSLERTTKYGRLKWRGRSVQAHCFAFIALGGVIPEGKELDHLCRIRHCCQMLCVEPVTHLENIHRARGMRAGGAPGHCLRGHALIPENMYTSPDGLSRCKFCRRIRRRQRRAELRAARQGGR